MMDSIQDATALGALRADAARLRRRTLRDLFADDADRFSRLSVRLGDLLIDFSKEKLDAKALAGLIALAEARGVAARRDAMVAGEKINETERRAVLHMALRDGAGARVLEDGEDVMPDVAAERDRFLAFAEAVRGGEYAPPGGGRFADVVNIGIGGSDLGPAMAVRALAPDHDGPRLHFVSNVDGAHLADTLKNLDPQTTLAIVASKTFTTVETMTNARSMRDWFEAAGVASGAHMAAVSTNLEATAAFGIDASRVFGFWDWVGGRYSVWSAIGLPLAIAIGADGFRAFLSGARAMDEHFRAAPLAENLPVLLALVGIWRRNFLGLPTLALIPYDQRLEFFAAYIQQLDMESNGKRTGADGAPVNVDTGPVIFGEPGTNGQHAFYQLLHQGTDIISADFIATAVSQSETGDHHEKLLSNFLAQTEALMRGKTEEEAREELAAEGRNKQEINALAPHKVFPGDRPTNSILMEKLTPETLGALIALYEHKIFCQGALWGINSFDQWGVELGKVLAKSILPELAQAGEEKPTASAHDASTNGLIDRINKIRKGMTDA